MLKAKGAEIAIRQMQTLTARAAARQLEAPKEAAK